MWSESTMEQKHLKVNVYPHINKISRNNNIENFKMVIQDQHTERLRRLLRKDADRRKYIKEYMKEYRAKKSLRRVKDRNNITPMMIFWRDKEHLTN